MNCPPFHVGDVWRVRSRWLRTTILNRRTADGEARFQLADLMATHRRRRSGLRMDTSHGVEPLGYTVDIPGLPLLWVELLLLSLTFPTLSCLTLAALILRLRRPRPKLTRLARQPGFIACSIAVVFLGWGFLIKIPYFYTNRSRSNVIYYYLITNRYISNELYYYLWFVIGSAITGAWICLKLGIAGVPSRAGSTVWGECWAGSGSSFPLPCWWQDCSRSNQQSCGAGGGKPHVCACRRRRAVAVGINATTSRAIRRTSRSGR